MLDEAIAKAKERAQERCAACEQQEAIDAVGFFFVGQSKCRGVNDPHTCHGDLVVVRDCMLAVWEMTCKAAMIYDIPFVKAEIERLLPEGSGKGER